ncbi:MAG: hypothetical protein CVU46_12835, partial [Chloroflexi bacterium HGW-Chloroflexi-8]
NAPLHVAGKPLTGHEVARMFGRPFMGGMERKGVIFSGDPTEIQQAASVALSQAPDGYILAADCTVPSETPWENLKTAIEVAHHYKK